MDFQLGIAEHYLSTGVEMVLLGDDLGSQIAPLLSPRIIEEFFVPEYERLFSLYRSRGTLIQFHSCGNIEPLLEVFLRLGVNILNPVQATANNLKEIRSATMRRMALQGGVSSATIMAGPADRIRSEAIQRMWELGREGGYFCQQDQGLPFPEEHLRILHDTVRDYGRYPLTPPDRRPPARRVKNR
jgi:uroporphyrinogen decarboxylase